MANLLVLEKSVGRTGVNLPVDVVKVGVALAFVGPARGGFLVPPLSLLALGDAIEAFQRFQKLAVADGRIDPNGGTVKRINAVISGGALPAPDPGPAGQVRRLATPGGLSTAIDANTWAPDEQSLANDFAFRWTGVAGRGRVEYFELAEDVVPNWFGVVIPDGATGTDHATVFFHPTPGQAGYRDATYRTKAGWAGVFHYMTDPMAAQFCATGGNQILIMPLMTESAAESCGVFPRRWESIVGQILSLVAAGPSVATAPARPVASLAVASFSSGITYNANFRAHASLGTRLRGIIDFDGIISSYSRHSQALSSAAPFPVVRMWQTAGNARTVATQAQHNMFPLPRERWASGPYRFPTGQAGLLQIHGTIPQTMMAVAASRTRPR